MASQEKARKMVVPKSVTGTGKIDDNRGKKVPIVLKANQRNDVA